MGFHGWAAASKPYITKCNAKRWMVRTPPLDSRAAEMRSLEWRITLLHLAIWWTSLGLAVARRTVLVWLHCAKCKVWWRGDYGVGLFFRSLDWPLSSRVFCSTRKDREIHSWTDTLWKIQKFKGFHSLITHHSHLQCHLVRDAKSIAGRTCSLPLMR